MRASRRGLAPHHTQAPISRRGSEVQRGDDQRAGDDRLIHSADFEPIATM